MEIYDFFFFQAEDGIRDKLVTGVQTCALPILIELVLEPGTRRGRAKESPVIRERLPDFARIALGVRGLAVHRSDAERLEWHAAGVQQPQDVMVRRDDERSR